VGAAGDAVGGEESASAWRAWQPQAVRATTVDHSRAFKGIPVLGRSLNWSGATLVPARVAEILRESLHFYPRCPRNGSHKRRSGTLTSRLDQSTGCRPSATVPSH